MPARAMGEPAIGVSKKVGGTRLSLSALQTVYLGPGRVGPTDHEGLWSMDATLSLVKGIRISATQEPAEVLSYLNDLKKRFILRGRIRRQLKHLLGSSRPLLGRGVVYASHPAATHRVLVYAYYGRLLREYSTEMPNGDIVPLPAYEASSYMMEPLARVDVRPPYEYLSRKHKVLAEYREAVASSAESMAIQWYYRFFNVTASRSLITRTRNGVIYDRVDRDPVGSASGIGADVICLLKPRDRLRQRVWKNGTKTKYGTDGLVPSRNTARSLSGFFDDLSKRR